MADYRTAYILSLIGGILILVNGIAWGALGGVASILPVPFAGPILLAVAIVGIIFGCLVMYGAMLMNKKGKGQTGSILVLVFSIISLAIGGGFIIGLILGLVGAIIGLTQKK